LTPMTVGAPHTVEEFVQGYESTHVLRGFRCPRCGALTATWGLACARCGGGPLEEAALPDHGRVVAGTIVAVASDEFVNDAPYAYVVVELEGGGRLSGWIPNVRSEEEIAPGTPVRFAPSYKPGVQFERVAAARTQEGSR
jgi:uncharacterized OB-fold protein